MSSSLAKRRGIILPSVVDESEISTKTNRLSFYLPPCRVPTGHISMIVPDRLYISDWEGSLNFDKLRDLNVKRIVCLERKMKDSFILEKYEREGISHHRIEIDDIPGVDIVSYKDDILKNIGDDDAAVLVHCLAGISRSVSAVMLYLCEKYAFTPHEAMCFIRENRPCAKPQYGFLFQIVKQYSPQTF